MANNKIQLWISPTDGKVYDSLNVSADPPKLDFIQGDEVEVELHLCKTIDGDLVEVDFPADSSVKLAIGRKEAAPEQGTYQISYGSESVTLSYAATSEQIQTALNGMVGIIAAGRVDVIRLSGVMVQIKFRNVGVNGTLTVNADGLLPASYGKVIPIRAGSSTQRGTYFLKVAQSPVVYQTVWDSIESVEPVAVSITTIALGYKRIEFTPAPSIGSWTISSTPNVWRAWRLQPNFGLAGEVTPAQWWGDVTSIIVPAIAQDSDFEFLAEDADVTDEKMYATSDYLQPKVKALGNGIYDVIWGYYPSWLPPDQNYYANVTDFTVAPGNYSYPLSVDASALKPRKGFTAKLNLNSAEVEYFLAGSSSATADLEVEVSNAGIKQTVLMTECTIKNDMIDGYAYAPIELDVARIPDAPSDGIFYGRKNAGWTPLTEIDGGTYE